ncbi:hypothetical protein KXR53_15105 [Inquilinus limosus]|uniref:hypothetical protein n=1 Tax=Inquilinus limosus TaxID=171674 RepID=UPI003F18CA31
MLAHPSQHSCDGSLVLGAVKYMFSNSISGAIGYRYLAYDFGGHALLDDLALYRPIAGVTIRF